MGLGPGQVRRWGEGHQVLGVAQALVSRRIIPWSPGAAAALHLAAGVVCTRKVCLWRHLSFGLLTLAGADWTWYEPCSPFLCSGARTDSFKSKKQAAGVITTLPCSIF